MTSALARFTTAPWLRSLTELALVAFGTTLLATRHTYGRWGALLALLGIALALVDLRRHERWPFERADWLPALAVLLFPLYQSLSILAHGGPPHLFEWTWHLFYALPVAFVVRRLRPSPATFPAGLAVGAGAAFALALLQVVSQEMERARGYWHMVVFGNLALAIGLLPLLCLEARWFHERLQALAIVGALAGTMASLLSGSRGGWLALPFFWLIWYRSRRPRVGGPPPLDRRLLGLFIGCAVAMAVVFGPGVIKRVEQAGQDIVAYRSGQVVTSLGMRFEMWGAAIDMAREHPLTGVGPWRFGAELAERVEQGKLPRPLLEFEHAHNEFLNILATQGAPGLLALLFSYLGLALYFERQRRIKRNREAPLAAMGLALVVMFAVFGLSEVMFAHRVSYLLFAVLIGVCWGFQQGPSTTRLRYVHREKTVWMPRDLSRVP
ncbi:O-antigen ligase family protein [Chitinimonas lacunae]|uniref:O-antigen ligase family protein n=1 Tax=Chitinimonas lacunae TaxID=1963018 RepID=A0ABV8MRC0_9NEIS